MRKLLIVLLGVMCASSLLLVSGPGFAENYDRHVLIINNTSVSMVGFYASNVGASGWQENILGGERLRPGERINVNIDDGTGYCLYDLKAVFRNGAYAENRRFNVCAQTYWRIYD